MRKIIINLLIILIWLLFGIGYFVLFQANRPVPKEAAFVRWNEVENGIGESGFVVPAISMLKLIPSAGSQYLSGVEKYQMHTIINYQNYFSRLDIKVWSY